MAPNIKYPETDRLARKLAELSGLPLTTAVRNAIMEIITRGRNRATIDARSEDEILGYDDIGLPR